MSLLWELLHWQTLIPWLLGMVFGVFVGSTPGLTATMAVALIVPISYHLEPATGLALIIGVSFTAIFAGDIPATYLRIPGTPASAAATLDGHQLARQGRGRLALRLDLFCSVIGGLIGVGLLAAVAPQLARFALQFTSYEYFWLGLIGLGMSALVSQGGVLRGLAAAAVGMLLSTVGLDGTSGVPRFTWGRLPLLNGLEVIPMMIGLFGLAEVLRCVRSPAPQGEGGEQPDQPAPLREVLRTIWRQRTLVGCSSLLGTLIGALPGAGADIAAWGAYGAGQRCCRRGREFGTGVEEGVIAPTSANNAAVAGAWIPALVFGVPGDAVTAIVLGALLVYDIKPGPRIFQDSGPLVVKLLAIAFLTQLLLIPAGLLGLRAFRWVMKLPRPIVLAAVVVFSVVGAYALRSSLFDVYVMIGAGVLGWFLESRRVPLAPIVLGLILGPMVEEELRKGLIASDGSLLPFVTRPLCLTMIGVLLIGFSASLIRWLRRSTRRATP